MKKNLAKRVVLGLLTGAVLMSSSVVWAENVDISDGTYSVYTFSNAGTIIGTSFGVGYSKMEDANEDINPGNITSNATNSIVIGINSHVQSENSVALGNNAEVSGSNSVALGYGSIASGENVVSVGSGVAGQEYATRSIINVTDVSNWKTDDSKGSYAVNVNTLKNAVGRLGDGVVVTDGSNGYGAFNCISVDQGQTLTETVGKLAYVLDVTQDSLYNGVYNKDDADDKFLSKTDAASTYLTQTQADGRYVQIGKNDATGENQPQISIDANGQMVFGDTSSWIDGDGKGFYAGTVNDALGHVDRNERAAIKETGEIVGAAGQFRVNGTTGNVTAQEVTATKFYISDGNNKIAIEDKFADKTETATALAQKANQSDLEAEKTAREQADISLQQQITELDGGNSEAISGINQRLDKTNAKINKVGAGAAALAALHPLDYDPDDKLTFSAGMGNYAGENAAALGAFYRPNEKFMVSLGGTMGNGENMVNLGISIGLDKANGFAKMSKRELIQEVNAVKAENEAIKADNEAMKAEMAEMKAMLQELLAKK